MILNLIKKEIDTLNVSTLVIFSKASAQKDKGTKVTHSALSKVFQTAIEEKTITGKQGEAVLFREKNYINFRHVLVVGLGKENELSHESIRQSVASIVDGLKKEKIIKSTLELVIQTKSEKICSLEKVDAEDWFTVSKVIQHDEEGELGVFEVEGETFKILKAAKCKCPRCWKYRAKSEEDLCHRCNEALNA